MRTGTQHSDKTKELIRAKTKKAMMSPETYNKIIKTAFKKGHKPWNKDVKGIHLSPNSEFKEDQFVGDKHPSWKGGVQTPKDDCAYLYTGKEQRVRRPVAIYEKYHGKIPKGYVIYHLDGNKLNDSPNNLIAISRGELMKRNSESRKRWRK